MSKFIAICVLFAILSFAWKKTDYKEPERASASRIVRRNMPVPEELQRDFPSDYTETHRKLAGVFEEATGMFTDGNIPVLALPAFAMTTGDAPELLNLVTKSAYSYLYNDKKVRVVRREYTAKSRIRARYILIGRVSPIGNQIRITVRIQDVNTGEILDAFDDYIDKAKVSNHL